MKNIKIVLSIDWESRILLLEAFLFLGWARILKQLPFSKIAGSLGEHMQETTYLNDPKNTKVLKKVSEAIQLMSRHTLWESQCLVQAIAGMKMLKRRKIESTLYLATAKDENGDFVAHAWLRSGSFYISGSEVMKGFTVVANFANMTAVKHLKGESYGQNT